jgi:HlyD family secretion protein
LSRARSWFTLVLIAASASAVWILSRRTAPPEVEFVKVARETIVSSLGTNGKVEPIEWLPARAERAGTITRVLIARGQQVKKGAPLVDLDTRMVNAELGKAQAAINEAQTQQQVLDQGGRIAERQQVAADLARARLDLEVAEKQRAALERLVAKQAATRLDLDIAGQAVEQLQLRIRALEQHKAVLVTGSDREIAKAKLGGAESAAAVARINVDLSVIRAPMEGTVYDFDLKAGAYLNPGDQVAKVGKLDRVRVAVYVDEPDVGKVHQGEAVIIT